MRIRSQQIARLNILHDFFENGIWKGIRIFPSPASEKLLAGNRMRILTDARGCHIVQDIVEYSSGFKAPGPEPFWIRLILEPLESIHQNFTELPEINLLRESIYFSLANETGSSVRFESSGRERFIRPIFARTFSLSDLPAGSPFEVFCREEKVFSGNADAGGNAEISLDNLPEGPFEVQVGGKLFRMGFTSDSVKKRYFAHIDLKVEAGGDSQSEYNLHFESREVFWKYTILSKQRNLEGVAMVDPNSVVEFGSLPSNPGTGFQGVAFMSRQKVKLQEKYSYSFKLLHTDGKTVLSQQIPVPAIKYLKKYPENEGSLMAESFLEL